MLNGFKIGLHFACPKILRSFGDARDADPGFRRDGVLLVAYDLSGRNSKVLVKKLK